MNATDTNKRINELKKTAYMESMASAYLEKLNQAEYQEIALKLKRSSIHKLKLAENLKISSRLNAISVRPVKITKRVRKGEYKIYIYWYTSWRINNKVRNIYLGPTDKMSCDEALIKARKLKAKDLHVELA